MNHFCCCWQLLYSSSNPSW